MESPYASPPPPADLVFTETWSCSSDCFLLIDSPVDDIYSFVLSVSRHEHQSSCPLMLHIRSKRLLHEYIHVDDNNLNRVHAQLHSYLYPGAQVSNPLGGTVEQSCPHPQFTDLEQLHMLRCVTLKIMDLGKFLGLWVLPWCRWVMKASILEQKQGLRNIRVPKVWELLVLQLRQPLDFNTLRIQGNTPAHWLVLAQPKLPCTTYTRLSSTSLKSPYFTFQLLLQHRAVYLNAVGIGRLTPLALAARLGKAMSVHALLYSTQYTYTHIATQHVPSELDIYEALSTSQKHGHYSCAYVIMTTVPQQLLQKTFLDNLDICHILYRCSDASALLKLALTQLPGEILMKHDALQLAVKGCNTVGIVLLLEKIPSLTDAEFVWKVAHAGQWSIFLRIQHHPKVQKDDSEMLSKCLHLAIQDTRRIQKLAIQEQDAHLQQRICSELVHYGAEILAQVDIPIYNDMSYPAHLFCHNYYPSSSAYHARTKQEVVQGNQLHLIVLYCPAHLYKLASLQPPSAVYEMLLQKCGQQSILAQCVKVGFVAVQSQKECIQGIFRRPNSADARNVNDIFTLLLGMKDVYNMNIQITTIGTYDVAQLKQVFAQLENYTNLDASIFCKEADTMLRTPIMYACVTGQLDMLQILALHCDMKSVQFLSDAYDATALHMSAHHQHVITYIATTLDLYKDE